MGASCGGVAFKYSDNSKVELNKIITDLFGDEFKENNGYCDSRNKDCIYIGRTKDFIVVINSDFANTFFKSTDSTFIEKYLSSFSNPELVFAFEEYDSGGS